MTVGKTTTLAELLTHLYVLIPVFDGKKHYWVGEDEMEKLLAKGEGWLAHHPEKEEIARRYLRFQPSLFRMALARLVQEEEPAEAEEENDQPKEKGEEVLEKPISSTNSGSGRSWPPCGRAGPGGCWTSAAGPARCFGNSTKTSVPSLPPVKPSWP